MIDSKKDKRQKVRFKIRKKVSGTKDMPRLAVFRSNKEIYAQLVNDVDGSTIVSVSSRNKEIKASTKQEAAAVVGKTIAELATKAGVETVAFDRNGYLYHGRIKVLAEAAREAGLKF